MFEKNADESLKLSHSARRTAWGIVLLISMMAIGTHAWIRQRQASAATAVLAQRQQLSAAASAATERFKVLFDLKKVDEFRPTLSEVEQAINGGRALSLYPRQPWPDRTSYLWNDPASGMEFCVMYDSEGRFSFDGRWPSGPLYPWAWPTPSPLIMKIRSLWQSSIVAGRLIWCGGFLLVIVAGRYRPALTEMLLALAVVWTFVGVFDPDNAISALAILNEDAFSWGLLMILVSAIVFLGTRRSYRPNLRLCSKCEYNLTGNVSGSCPECGTEIPPRVREYIA